MLCTALSDRTICTLIYTSNTLSRVRTTNIPPPDPRKSHRRIGVVSPNERRISLGATVRPGTITIKPLHPQSRIIPDTEHRHHAPPQRLAHARQPTQRLERARPRAECLCHRDGPVPDDLAVLQVQPADLGKYACRGVIGRDELRDDGYGLGGVDGETVAVADGVAFGAGVCLAVDPGGGEALRVAVACAVGCAGGVEGAAAPEGSISER